MIDDQMRPLFAYMRALPCRRCSPRPRTGAHRAADASNAATELVLLEADVAQRIVDGAWSGYQHEFAGNATRSARSSSDVDRLTAHAPGSWRQRPRRT